MNLREQLRKLTNDEGDLRATAERAQKAQRILEEPLFKDACQDLQDRLYKDFCDWPVDDAEGLRQIRIMKASLDKVIKQISLHMRDGIMAEDGIAKIKEKRAFLKKKTG